MQQSFVNLLVGPMVDTAVQIPKSIRPGPAEVSAGIAHDVRHCPKDQALPKMSGVAQQEVPRTPGIAQNMWLGSKCQIGLALD